MSADRDITPRVIAYLRAELPNIERRRRVSPLVAQVVLRQLARWARRADEPGQWTATDSVGQIEAGTGIKPGSIRKALDNLEHIGLVVTVRRGGGRGQVGRGSIRTLYLDPAGVQTPRAQRAQFQPKLRALRRETPRATTQTPRAQARDTASSSASSSAPALPADDSPIPPALLARWADRLPKDAR